ncbi:hypothetical protein AGMMS49940_19270 [Spirochaetia bacterium]|nr:hypothetical protein AGMMS49940_19270 [Spirochaetia bacterium]
MVLGDTAPTDPEFDEAIRILSTFPEEAGAAATEQEKRMWAIVLRQDGYNTLPQDMQDVLTWWPDDSAKMLDLIERLELLAPVLEVDAEVLSRIRDMALFSFKRRQLDVIMVRGRGLLDRGDYVAALGCYRDGLDIYQDEFFDIGYGRDINAPVRESLAALAEAVGSFPRLFSGFKGAIAGINGIGVSGDTATLARLREYYARLTPLIQQVITLNTAIAEAGNTFDAYMARIRQRDTSVGDRSFLVFASRLIHGQRDGEGMLGAAARLWTALLSPLDALLAANTERAYQNASSSAQFESVIAYSALGMGCLEDWRRFYQGQDVQTYQYFDDTVLASKAEAYLRYASFLLASESLRDAAPLLEQYSRIVSMNTAASGLGSASGNVTMTREAELQRLCRELARTVEPVQEGLRVNAEALRRYRSALSGQSGLSEPLLYPPMEQALSRFNSMDIFALETASVVRGYMLANRDFGRQVTEWQTRLTETNRLYTRSVVPAETVPNDEDIARNTDVLNRFVKIEQGLSSVFAAGQALLARYNGESPRMAAEPRIAGLSRDARALMQELEALQRNIIAQETSVRDQIRELEDRRAAALARELERLRLEAEAQEELARAKAMEEEQRRAAALAAEIERLRAETAAQEKLARSQALAEEERRAQALARELEEMRAKALADELERLRVEAQAQENLARNKEMAEEERRARALSLELESLQAKAQAEELAQLRAEAQAQEHLARTKALAEEERHARSLAEQLAELQASAQAKAQAQELEKLRMEAQAQEELARTKAMADEQHRAQVLARELEESRTKALARELEENRAKVLAQELMELQEAIRARQALTPALIAQAEALRQEGDRFLQEARSALSQGNYDRARDRVLRAGERYDASLVIQETPATRQARDVDLVALGAEINRLENQKVIQELRPLVTRAQAAYEASSFEEAEQLLLRALSLWRRTNVEDDPELIYWLDLVRRALALRAGRVIPVTAPLYAEMSQLLSEAKKLYNDGAALVQGNKRAEGSAKFDEARRKTQEVKLVFPVNQEANLLELRIDQVTNPEAFNADFRRRLDEAVAGTKRKDLPSFAALQNLADINPGYPGIRGMVVQAEIDLGYRPPPPDTRARDRSTELTAAALGIIERNERARFPAALAQLNQALVLDPTNRQATILKDRLQTSRAATGDGGGGGGAPLVLSNAAEREYQRAVRELQQGNILVARDIVQQLMADPRNRTTRLTDLQRRIQSYL